MHLVFKNATGQLWARCRVLTVWLWLHVQGLILLPDRMTFCLPFQARVEDLQEYVEILKAELEASKKREKARKVRLSQITGLVCKILNFNRSCLAVGNCPCVRGWNVKVWLRNSFWVLLFRVVGLWKLFRVLFLAISLQSDCNIWTSRWNPFRWILLISAFEWCCLFFTGFTKWSDVFLVLPEEPGLWYGRTERGGPGTSDRSYEARCGKTSGWKWSVEKDCWCGRTSLWWGYQGEQKTQGKNAEGKRTTWKVEQCLSSLWKQAQKW